MHPTTCDHVLDVVQNAFESGATEAFLGMVRRGSRLEVEVRDNGRGMDAATLRRALDPFWSEPGKHPGRKVGLGLPFLKMAAEQCGGALEMESAPGRGTTVRFWFDLSNVDAPPTGDLPGTLTALMNGAGACELAVRREEDGRAYEVRRSELLDALGGIGDAGSLALAKEFFSSNEEGIANEVQDGKADIG